MGKSKIESITIPMSRAVATTAKCDDIKEMSGAIPKVMMIDSGTTPTVNTRQRRCLCEPTGSSRILNREGSSFLFSFRRTVQFAPLSDRDPPTVNTFSRATISPRSVDIKKTQHLPGPATPAHLEASGCFGHIRIEINTTPFCCDLHCSNFGSHDNLLEAL